MLVSIIPTDGWSSSLMHFHLLVVYLLLQRHQHLFLQWQQNDGWIDQTHSREVHCSADTLLDE